MSIFAAPSFYNQADQNIFNQGDRFITQEEYRLGDPIQKNISFDSGITNTAAATPFILPINQRGGGGEGGGGITTAAPDTSGFDYETDAYDLENKSAFDKGLTEEEDEALDNLTNPGLTKGMIGTIGGTVLGFLNPFTAIASLAYQGKKQKEALEEAAREAATQAAGRGFDMAGTGDKSGGRAGGGGFGGNTAGGFSESDPGATEGSHADGGRVGYMMGGIANLVDIYD